MKLLRRLPLRFMLRILLLPCLAVSYQNCTPTSSSNLLSSSRIFASLAQGGTLCGNQTGGMIDVSQCSGANAGAQIQSCLSSIPNGGICDARKLLGTQTISSSLDIGPSNVELMLGSATFVTAGTIYLGESSSIIGMPSGMEGGGTVIRASTSLPAVIRIVGYAATVRDIVIDGNNHMASVGIWSQSARTLLSHLTAQHANQAGIQLGTQGQLNQADGAKLEQVLSIDNNGQGLYGVDSADTFISNCEFENNGATGIELSNSPTYRIEHNDIGGNGCGPNSGPDYGTGCTGGNSGCTSGYCSGIWTHGLGLGTGFLQIITGNQFGNNAGHDLEIDGSKASSGNIVVANEFYPSAYRPAGRYNAIAIIDNANNVLSSNYILNMSGHLLYSGIGIFESSPGSSGVNTVFGNTISGPPTTVSGIYVPPGTILNSNNAFGSPVSSSLSAFANNNFIEWQDGTPNHTPNPILGLGSDDVVYLMGHPITQTMAFQPKPGATALQLSSKGASFFVPVTVAAPGSGLNVKSPDGTKCATIGIDNNGAVLVTSTPCS